MTSKLIKAELLTPQRLVFSGEVVSVTLPGEAGSFQVLYNHAPLLSNLEIGIIKLSYEDGKKEYFAINDGFVKVENNVVTVLGDSIENSNEINYEEAESEFQNFKKLLNSKEKDIDKELITKKIKQAQNKLKLRNN